MQSPYPDILFHFTSRLGLRGILTTGFRPSYAREKIVGMKSEKSFSVPMISFSDLRVSELPFHMSKYTKFGIGMKKSWALPRGLNPVAYVNKQSEFTNSLFAGLEEHFKQIQKIDDWDATFGAEVAYMKLLNVLRYVKNYQGDLERQRKTTKNYRFADEREWRFVLPLSTKNILPFAAPQNMKSPSDKKLMNDQLEPFRLNFMAMDVKYIIVPAERNIQPMRNFIQSLDPLFAEPDRQHLLARILTAEQINSDM